jgi:thioesterase domain-containing protein
MARIKNELGTELPLRILFEGPTIGQLAPKIHSKKQESIFYQREHGSHAHLFELQAGDQSKPIFCFPFRGGLDGEFFNFIRMARHFDSQYSFYGVMARGIDGVSEPRSSVQEMVADYLKEIRSVQPHGPYIFVGECQGGFVAYEAARQMMADGGEMGLLVLLDTHTALPARGFWRRWAAPLRYRAGKSPAWKYFRSRYDYHLQAIRQQSATAALGYSMAKLTRAVSTIPYLIDLEQAESPRGALSNKDRVRLQLDKLKKTFDLAIRRYVMQCYSGRVSLLLNERSHSMNVARGWADYLPAGVEVHKLPGDHDVCVPRNIPLVAQILKDCLAGVEKKT